MGTFSRLKKFIRTRFKRKSKPSSARRSADPISNNWVFNPDALSKSKFIPPENISDSYENPISFGTFYPDPRNDSLDYDNKLEESETANKVDTSLGSSESFLQENAKLKEENNRLKGLLSYTPPSSQQPSSPPPPPPPPSADIYETKDFWAAVKDNIAKAKGLEKQPKNASKTAQPGLPYLNELKEALEQRKKKKGKTE